MAKGKYARQAEEMTLDISALFNRGIRSALLAGLATAVRGTKHDSSNAAAHWLVAMTDGGKSRPWQRKFGKLRDLRGTRGRGEEGPRLPTAPVGYRRDAGKNATRTLKFVRDRELKEVIDRFVHGRNAPGKFYFYHPLAEGILAEDEDADGDLDLYAHNANIEQAGNSAVEAAGQVFQRNIAAGNYRKGRR